MKKLYEVAHPYHQWELKNHKEWETWAEFYDEFKDADVDYNLVIRWDWITDLVGYEIDHETLQLIIFRQRLGQFSSHYIKIASDNEESVRDFLTNHHEEIKDMWHPFK